MFQVSTRQIPDCSIRRCALLFCMLTCWPAETQSLHRPDHRRGTGPRKGRPADTPTLLVLRLAQCPVEAIPCATVLQRRTCRRRAESRPGRIRGRLCPRRRGRPEPDRNTDARHVRREGGRRARGQGCRCYRILERRWRQREDCAGRGKAAGEEARCGRQSCRGLVPGDQDEAAQAGEA